MGFLVLVWAGGTYYFYQDNERKLAEARNQGTEIISTDPKTGVITARDKKTGKIITMDMNDIEPDQVSPPDLASSVPPYPNAVRSPSAKSGSLSLATPDPIAKVVSYYEAELRKGGLAVTKEVTPPGGPASIVTLTGTDAGKSRKVTITVRSNNHGTTVEITE